MLAFMWHTTQIVGVHVFDDVNYFRWEAIQTHDVPKGRVVNAIESFLEVYESRRLHDRIFPSVWNKVIVLLLKSVPLNNVSQRVNP